MISFFLCCDKQIFYDFYGTKRFRGQFPRDIVLLKSSMKIYLLNIGEILKSKIQKLLSKAYGISIHPPIHSHCAKNGDR